MLGDQFMSLRRENMAKKSTSELNSNDAVSDLSHSVKYIAQPQFNSKTITPICILQIAVDILIPFTPKMKVNSPLLLLHMSL